MLYKILVYQMSHEPFSPYHISKYFDFYSGHWLIDSLIGWVIAVIEAAG